jgi:hypothetical protein
VKNRGERLALAAIVTGEDVERIPAHVRVIVAQTVEHFVQCCQRVDGSLPNISDAHYRIGGVSEIVGIVDCSVAHAEIGIG